MIFIIYKVFFFNLFFFISQEITTTEAPKPTTPKVNPDAAQKILNTGKPAKKKKGGGNFLSNPIGGLINGAQSLLRDPQMVGMIMQFLPVLLGGEPNPQMAQLAPMMAALGAGGQGGGKGGKGGGNPLAAMLGGGNGKGPDMGALSKLQIA